MRYNLMGEEKGGWDSKYVSFEPGVPLHFTLIAGHCVMALAGHLLAIWQAFTSTLIINADLVASTLPWLSPRSIQCYTDFF